MLKNQGGTPRTHGGPAQRSATDCEGHSDKPPEGFPSLDPAKPDTTDFQFMQAVALAKAMAAQTPVVTAN